MMGAQNFKSKRIFISVFFLAMLSCLPSAYCQIVNEQVQMPSSQIPPQEEPVITSEEIVKLAWEASSRNDVERLEGLAQTCRELYENKARELQSQLSGFPLRGQEVLYQSLNDFATCLFIRGEALMIKGKKEDAILQFQEIIDDYSFAQAWDPSRGSFWSVAEKAQASIDVLTGKAQRELDRQVVKVNPTIPKRADAGSMKIVDYTKFGVFENVGTEDYRYVIKDMAGLKKAIGEGIYPNNRSIYDNPLYAKVRKEERLKMTHWDFVNSEDLEAAYFKWVLAPEPEGVRLFYLGIIFEKAGMYYEALKAYHALVVHFPKTVAWTYWQTPWYPGQAAVAKIKHIIRIHPELNLTTKWMNIRIKNGFDNDASNDIVSTYPGKIVEKNLVEKIMTTFNFVPKAKLGKVKKTRGTGAVRLLQYENKHWQMLVDNKPYVIRGVTYEPTKVGQTPDKGTLANWTEADTNGNGKIDGPYDAWVDANGNNKQDSDEPVIGDFKLMKDMGVNTLRIYYQPHKPNKELLRKMYEEFGFKVIMGNFLGKYAIGSGASWGEGTDYENPEHRKKMMESIQEMVMEYKDEPYILLWLLGNENNYGVASNADKKPKAFFEFTNEVAQWIKSVDLNHPVAVNNGDTLYLDIFADVAPDVDIFTANVYRGDYGFGSFWEQVREAIDRPAFITEYGCPAYAQHLTLQEAEKAQAYYHMGNWIDIEENMAQSATGVGNALGGVIFEWLDEWWKNYEPFLHDRSADTIGPFPGGFYYEEWFGLLGQGNGQHSPFLRHLRESYYMYKDIWSKYK